MSSRPDRRGHRDRRGAGSLLICGVLVAILGGAVALVVVGRYVIADHRAGTAADQAAWAGAAAHARGVDACAAARETARRNGARLTDCAVAGDAVDFVVGVEVFVPVEAMPSPLPDRMRAVAHAGRMG